MSRRPPALALAVVLSAAALPGWAPAAPPADAAARPAAVPDTQAMIEALKPSATRSLRNLVVRPRAEAASAAAPAAAVAAAASAAPAPSSASAAPAAAPASAASAASAAAAPAPASTAAPSLALAIQFEPNSSRVRPVSGPVLGSLVAALQSPELKGSRFVIEGHADGRGAPEHNLRLSQARAEEVRLYLVALGVHPSRLRAVGKGASEPARPGEPAAAENRRVRVVTVE